jgi:hypothetical protein
MVLTLTDEQRLLLETGASTAYGRCCYPRDVRPIRHALNELYDLGLIHWGDNGETPIITEAGRQAVGGKTEGELRLAEFAAAARPVTVQAPKEAPLDFKFRYGRTLVFAMVEHRQNDAGTASLLSLNGYHADAKWFPKYKLSIQRSRIEPRFMVVTMPGALANEKGLQPQPTHPRLSAMIAWSDESKAEWESVCAKRIEINNAVQGSRPKRKHTKHRFGEFA